MTFPHVLARAGLTKVELAVLYGVSRQTIHAWSTGGSARPGSYTERMERVITRALYAAIGKHILPMTGMDKDRRKQRVLQMSITLQNLKPAPAK